MPRNEISSGPSLRAPDARRVIGALGWLAGATASAGMVFITAATIVSGPSGGPEVRQPKTGVAARAATQNPVIRKRRKSDA